MEKGPLARAEISESRKRVEKKTAPAAEKRSNVRKKGRRGKGGASR